MLTRKQNELLLFIFDRIRTTGVSPSFDEMKEALNLKSKSGIHRLISALEERGFLRRLPHKARALEILRMPETAADPALPPKWASESWAREDDIKTGFRPSVINGGVGDLPQQSKDYSSVQDVADNDDLISISLVGQIAAGTPIEALQDDSHHIDFPASMLGGGEHYALTVRGDSMIDAGIHDGDTVIIQRCNSAENGTIVVALVDDHEATLKRIRRKGNSIALEAANPAYETRIFGPDRVKVQGRLVSLLRQY